MEVSFVSTQLDFLEIKLTPSEFKDFQYWFLNKDVNRISGPVSDHQAFSRGLKLAQEMAETDLPTHINPFSNRKRRVK